MEDHPIELPPAPRASTSKARRRSWFELPLRNWIVLSFFVLLGTGYFTASQIIESLRERRLINGGYAIDAKIEELQGRKTAGAPFDRNDGLYITLSFVNPGDNKPQSMKMRLEPQPGTLRVGENLPIRVDRENPAIVTDRLVARSWYLQLTSVYFLLPLLIGAIGVVLYRRSRVLRVWRQGELFDGLIVEVKTTPIAPSSKIVRFTPMHSDDHRIFSVLVPVSLGIPEKGETIHLIALPGRPGLSIAAGLYV